jgi:site-specific DNA-cytosine methylase
MNFEPNDYVELPSGLIVSEAVAAMTLRPRPRAVDLFCGCGGFSLGLIEAGFEVVAAADNWPIAAMTYLYNLGAYPMQFHFVTPEDEKRMEKDVCGSPPCQGFSTSGKREVMDPRNNLVFEFCRLVCELFPKTMIFENVPGIMSMRTPDGLPIVDTMCRILQDGGFGTLDALRRSLGVLPGSKGVLRSQPREDKKKTEKPKAVKPAQATLFR